MTHNGQRTEFLNDPTGISDVVAEYDSSGQLRARYTYGIDLTSRVDAAGNATYFDMDEIGSVVGVSGGLGSYLNAYTYLPYGGVLHSTEAIDNPFQFIGAWGVMAEDNGLHFMRNRFYDSATGTFLSTDPLWIPGTSAYEYANNNPLQFADADGLKPKKKPLSPKWKEILERYRKEAEKRLEQERNNPSISKRIRDLVGQNTKDAHAECEADPNCQPRRNAGGNGGRGDGGPQGGGVGGSQGSGSKDSQDNKNAKGPPPVCGCDVRDEGTVGTPRSRDPNQKLSVAGFGDEHFVAGSRTVPYRIEYENLGPGSVPAPAMPATAPAQRVEISDQLTGDLDWNSVEFSEFGFGDFLFRVPSGRQYHSQTVSVNYDGKSLEVDIELRFDALTGMLTAVFQSVDPETLLPPSVLVGFLPPEDGSGVGRGFVGFRAGIRPGIPSGTELRNVALIRFDGQSVIATNQIDAQNPLLGTSPDLEAMVTMDAGAPESSLAPAATTTSGSVRYRARSSSGSSARWYVGTNRAGRLPTLSSCSIKSGGRWI